MLERTGHNQAETRSHSVSGSQPSLLPLEVRDLTYNADARQLITGVDLSILADTITVILGSNGSGKTLLLRLLHGLIHPTSGTISWGSLGNDAVARLRQAMVFQRPVLLRRSVAANIDFVLQLRGVQSIERRNAVLDHVGLLDRANQPARLLSGGEQQRLALARALAVGPEVLLLDEPTASLDPASVLLIEQTVVSAHNAGTKIIFVTHDIAQARRLAHDIVFMDAGRVVEHEPAERFFNTPSTDAARAYLEGRIFLPRNDRGKELGK
jgi:tungstate transport system ATP-binding protein